MKIKRVEKRGKQLHVYEDIYKENWGCGPVYDFPSQMVTDQSDKVKLLSAWACNDALGYMYELADRLLQGITTTVEEVRLGIRNDLWAVQRYYGNGKAEGTGHAHLALAIEAPTGQSYIVDISGAQFGQHNAVVPFDTYFQHFAVDIGAIRTHGHSTKDIAALRNGEKDYQCPPTTDFRIYHVQHEFHKRFSAAIQDWEIKNKTSLPRLLQAPQTTYEKGKRSFFQHLCHALRLAITEWRYGWLQDLAPCVCTHGPRQVLPVASGGRAGLLSQGRRLLRVDCVSPFLRWKGGTSPGIDDS